VPARSRAQARPVAATAAAVSGLDMDTGVFAADALRGGGGRGRGGIGVGSVCGWPS
jgi:hypothetical protein